MTNPKCCFSQIPAGCGCICVTVWTCPTNHRAIWGSKVETTPKIWCSWKAHLLKVANKHKLCSCLPPSPFIKQNRGNLNPAWQSVSPKVTKGKSACHDSLTFGQHIKLPMNKGLPSPQTIRLPSPQTILCATTMIFFLNYTMQCINCKSFQSY